MYDGEMAISLMKDVVENYNWKIKFVMMDAGYDQVKNYEATRSYGAQAIIAMNRRVKKNRLPGWNPTAHPVVRWGMTWCIGEPTVIG